eukprot:MONOS_10405.1-p1 / transcript=MONOS_10405.1 / gene=MONOS_10405 / organism=Monocercomonoides_exilis_PA203 / gene_product=unspecified product / transcript_product=unspecified product / location=Mono_scaffold00473:235-1092(+) / protein_length=196 / sequence_SO=supercontig / SO=protein_coding / is_pseudo=false
MKVRAIQVEKLKSTTSLPFVPTAEKGQTIIYSLLSPSPAKYLLFKNFYCHKYSLFLLLDGEYPEYNPSRRIGHIAIILTQLCPLWKQFDLELTNCFDEIISADDLLPSTVAIHSKEHHDFQPKGAEKATNMKNYQSAESSSSDLKCNHSNQIFSLRFLHFPSTYKSTSLGGFILSTQTIRRMHAITTQKTPPARK